MDSETKDLRTRLFLAFYTNIIVAIAVVCLVIFFHDENSPYLRTGWHDDLVILGIKINTKARLYLSYLCFGTF